MTFCLSGGVKNYRVLKVCVFWQLKTSDIVGSDIVSKEVVRCILKWCALY